ncbi:ADP-sugar pyrophosphatase-like [Mya arenaria]|uniref:ADP-sugar pyrophosphatase-like n=1 Tax=Mya arenaria TaxID=6604 RepID=UPI0022DF5B86|nr:ADP-sugar pyrophosphatase-like [Mya arenaria]
MFKITVYKGFKPCHLFKPNQLYPTGVVFLFCKRLFAINSYFQWKSKKMEAGSGLAHANQCRFVSESDIASGKWVKLSKVTYTDPTGKQREWEAVRRTTKVASDLPDAVVAIPILRRTLHYDCFILIKQFRPPISKYTIEFPAGLLDASETAERCAVRELLEETGYTGTVKHTSPATSLEPGLGDMTAQLVSVEIDGDLPENQSPKSNCDEGGMLKH